MKNVYRKAEVAFEKLASLITALLGNSLSFILALGTVIFWLTNHQFFEQDLHHEIGDAILGVTFLSLFIIQKSFNRFSGSLHLKINELVASHEFANNKVINIEEKSEHEITELSKEYAEMAEIAEKQMEDHEKLEQLEENLK
jgi:low affinity Fe/Cu permease